MRDLLKAPGIDINARDYNGDTALILAARWSRTEAVKLLTAVGAYTDSLTNIKDQSNKIRDAIDEGKLLYDKILDALKSGNIASLREIASEGYTLNIRDTQANGAMHIILDSHELKTAEEILNILQWLYAYDSRLATIENKLGENAIHRAVKWGDSPVLRWLVEAAICRNCE